MSRSLFVSGLSPHSTVDDLHGVFSQCGRLKDIYVPKDFYTKEPRGFAYVEFYDERDCEYAYRRGNVFIRGREVVVEFAKGDRKTPYEMSRIDRYAPRRRRHNSPERQHPPRRHSPDRRRQYGDDRRGRYHGHRSPSHSRSKSPGRRGPPLRPPSRERYPPMRRDHRSRSPTRDHSPRRERSPPLSPGRSRSADWKRRELERSPNTYGHRSRSPPRGQDARFASHEERIMKPVSRDNQRSDYTSLDDRRATLAPNDDEHARSGPRGDRHQDSLPLEGGQGQELYTHHHDRSPSFNDRHRHLAPTDERSDRSASVDERRMSPDDRHRVPTSPERLEHQAPHNGRRSSVSSRASKQSRSDAASGDFS